MKFPEALKISFLLCLIASISFAFTAVPSMADDTGTVDELFDLFIDGWVKPSAPVDAVTADVNAAFLAQLVDAEPRFGHLPEYWELLAQVNLRDVDFARNIIEGDWLDFSIQDDVYLRMNPLMLQKALEIDPARPADLWNLGRIAALDAWPDWDEVTFTERYDATPSEYLRFYADGLSSAGAADPGNAYYPFFEAAKRFRLGDPELAIDLFKRAAECDNFSQPVMFPRSYAIGVIDDFKNGTGIFSDFTAIERDYFGANFYYSRTAENFPELRQVYRELTENPPAEWKSTFNILNAVACLLGENDSADTIYQITAITLVKICRDAALTIAKDNNDTDLEIALLALWHETENIRTRLQMQNTVEDRTSMLMRPILTQLFEIDISPSSTGKFADFVRFLQDGPYTPEDLDWADMYLTDYMMGVVYLIKDKEFSDKNIYHIFERIELFDYEDPLWWYNWWENEGRISPARDKQGYREYCAT